MRFGVELEGGFQLSNYPCEISLEDLENEETSEGTCGCVMKKDGSVSVYSQICDWIGEINSPILSSLEEVKKFIFTHAPLKANDSCGFHLHLSFDQDTRSAYRFAKLLENRNLEEEFLSGLAEVGETLLHKGKMSPSYEKRLSQRISGKNDYCQRRRDLSCRYRALNWCAFSSHRTLEIRVFPGGNRGDAFAMFVLAEWSVKFLRMKSVSRERKPPSREIWLWLENNSPSFSTFEEATAFSVSLLSPSHSLIPGVRDLEI